MSERQFTFFELHFHDGVQLGPRALGGDGVPDAPAEERADGAATAEPEPETTAAGEPVAEPGTSLLGPLVGLGVLAAVAYAVRKLLASEPEGLDALDDVEAEAEETAAALQTEAEDAVPIEITSPEEESGRTGLAVAAAVGLLLVVALAARRLLGGSEEIVVEE